MIKLILIVVLSLSVVSVHAEEVAAPTGSVLNTETEYGWWFYDDPEKTEEEEEYVFVPQPKPVEAPETEKPEENPCEKAETWTAGCGFIDPGRNFEFQAKQRDALLMNMVMNPDQPESVEAFQYYMKWIMDQAVSVGNMWYYNRIQNPELDPQAANPISSFGLKLASQVKESRSKEIFDLLSEDGMLIYFSRSDCSYCHDMIKTVMEVARQTGIELWNASLDEECLPGFKQCRTAPETLQPAAALQVATVPTLFLYVEPNTWIRVSTGVSDQLTLRSRIVNFFSAYRAALVKGVENGEGMRPSVDFSPKDRVDGRGLGAGVEASPDKTISTTDVKRLLQTR